MYHTDQGSVVRGTIRAIFNLSVESNPGLHWFFFTTLCDWSRNFALPLSQSEEKPKPLATWSLAFSRVSCIYFEFSLVPCGIYLCSDWPL